MSRDDIYDLIDYSKTFDRLQHNKLKDIMKTIGIDDKDLRIIKNLYWNQMAQLKHKRTLSGVRKFNEALA